MPRPASALAEDLVGHYKYLEKTRTKMERLFNSSALVRRDIEQVYAGLYLNAVTSFEQFLESLFIGLLAERISPSLDTVVPRVTFRSDRVARDVVHSGRNYVDWLPYSYTEQRAKVFFRGGRPFSLLTPDEKRTIERIMYTRNSIAHQSKYSQMVFESKVLGSLPLAPRERTPTGFLRSRFRTAPVQTRYELYVTEMAAIARKLCS
jgi:hypothetical protein